MVLVMFTVAPYSILKLLLGYAIRLAGEVSMPLAFACGLLVWGLSVIFLPLFVYWVARATVRGAQPDVELVDRG